MKLLITGATGVVGQALVELCHQNDIPVNYLTTSKEKITSEDNYRGFYWNPARREIDTQCFNGVTAIINLAGASISNRWTSSYKKLILESRVDSLQTLYGGLKQCDSSAIKTFISASAIGIYPDSLTNFYTEDQGIEATDFLGEVVKAWEQEANKFRTLQLEPAIVRIGLVLSNEGGALPEMTKPVKYFVGAGFGSGEQWQSWIHIRDLARMFLFIVSNELSGIYNGVAPNPVTNNKLIKEIAQQQKRPLFLPNIPKFLLKAILGEMSTILVASQRVSSRKIEKMGFSFKFQNICTALMELQGTSGNQKATVVSEEKEFVQEI